MTNKFDHEQLYQLALDLLSRLIETPSISKHEDKSAELIFDLFSKLGIKANRHLNNIWVNNKTFNPNKKTVLLNSHHDTVQANQSYTKDPFCAIIEDSKLYGLGSNDAGISIVCQLATFLYFYESDLPFNLIYSATAEEEISGINGVRSIFSKLGNIDLAIVGEPTKMDMAIAERGLLVLDCTSYGKLGHAAREEGENAIYNALEDIIWFKSYSFPKVSKFVGPIKMSVTVINSGKQHNVVPDICKFVVDVRVNELYTNEEILETITQNVKCEVLPRSMILKSSSISENHPIVQAGKSIGMTCYGSPTSSDQAVMDFPSIKIGPGDSARSHSADEFVYLHEIHDGIAKYVQLLEKYIENETKNLE